MPRYKNEILNQIVTDFENRLEKAAQTFLEKTLSQVGHGGSSYENDTMNLYDSYGYAIFYDGKLLRSSTTPGVATKPRLWYGNQYFGSEILRQAFAGGDYKPSENKGYVVVFGALMPYGSILEEGGGNLKRKYKVIIFMEDEARKFGESVGLKNIVRDVRLRKYEVR